MLGYCPQQSILYDTLTVVEHLHLYSILKGSKDGEVRLLALVDRNLFNKCNVYRQGGATVGSHEDGGQG